MSDSNINIVSLAVGFCILAAGLLGIYGLTFALKGIREENSWKKLIGFLFNVGITSSFVLIVILNLTDFSEWFF